MLNETSKYRIYSTGIVVEDNIDNLTRIKITPLEQHFDLEHPRLDHEEEWDVEVNNLKVKGTGEHKPDYLPNKEVAVFNKTNWLWCNWVSLLNPNRTTPPNVGKGEKVLILQYSNNGEFLWITESTDLNLRKEEHVVTTYSAKDKLDPTEDPIKDRYSFTVSTRDKIISLHTTDKYGEFTTYDIEIDTKAGNIEIRDGLANSIKLDSAKDAFEIITKKEITTTTTKHHEKASEKHSTEAPEIFILGGITHINP